jgi:TonB family protein
VQAAEQASLAPVDPLIELEPMAAEVDSLPEEPQPQALKGWASVTERLNKIRQEPAKPAAPKADLLSYENSQSTTAPANRYVDATFPQSLPTGAPAAAQAEAELFAYIEGEAAESAQPKVANPPPQRGLRLLVVTALAVLSAVAVWKVPPARQAVGKLYGSVFHAGSDWLNPQPVSAPQAPAQHETFGQSGEEYKLPVAANIPDATTDPAQIRVLPVVDPTAKPGTGAAGTAQSPTAAGEGANGDPRPAPDAQATGSDQNNQNSGGGQPMDQTSSASGVPVPPVPAVMQNPAPRPAAQPAHTVSQPHTVAVASNTAIPSSLQSQMASSSPDASGNKPVDAALPAIQPVNLTEAAARSLLVQQPDPVYPDSAKSSRQQGNVVLQVLIGADGSVQDAKFLQGSLVFARAAIDAVKQWRFKPYQMNGRAAAAQTVLTISFRPPA